jgi:hypothetical protein
VSVGEPVGSGISKETALGSRYLVVCFGPPLWAVALFCNFPSILEANIETNRPLLSVLLTSPFLLSAVSSSR